VKQILFNDPTVASIDNPVYSVHLNCLVHGGVFAHQGAKVLYLVAS
jgi:hypothetical protein